ncbi:putative bifunctional diguanylate cyclase/phosphodiesterase [Deinococcus peraridilitoris]|uniref:putative bifunctional diguanylate cyclase/phosphodiesterase n=1 Tax=Deinococcus peraridilitoris TaxID=432329 RepID=UPI00069459EB|nr:EAL domain-containing protein [Deinococcus peraridilitoris]
MSVLFIDLDRFKPVNDLFGHAIGDALLKQVAGRIRQILPPNTLLARVGGDELIVVAEQLNRNALGQMAAEILKHLAIPYQLNGRPLAISASIGIALVPHDALDAQSALGHADLAMYRAKQSGGNAYRFFEASWHDETSGQFEIEVQLQGALERGEFELHYQPIVDPHAGSLRSFEALLRWHNPVLGMVGPDRFIPVAEQCGLILRLGEWVLREAAWQIQSWRALGYGDVRVSVNVSPVQFAQSEFVETVTAALHAAALPGQAVGLELTESALIHDIEGSNAKLAALRAMGLRIALDDFGTGFSSLSYLQRLDVDALKIDRSFVWSMDQKGGSLVRAIVELAHELGLRVVAEGVETASQLAGVSRFECDSVQGYFFSKPLRAVDALEYLQRDAARPKGDGQASGVLPDARALQDEGFDRADPERPMRG